ncbi:MAG TPA: hypothetical protein VJZ77_20435 [Blastocatellia bacterium]|nr:hypothetical protein [Blastocatellia bacterium]
MNTNIHEYKRENVSQTISQTGNNIRVHSRSFVAKNISVKSPLRDEEWICTILRDSGNGKLKKYARA